MVITLMFSKSTKDIDGAEDMVTWIILVYSVPSYALLDCGTCYSFVSREFSKEFPMKPEKLDNEYCGITLRGDMLESDTLHKNCRIDLVRKEYGTNSLQLDLLDFDVISWMDSLVRNYVYVNC